MGLFDRFPFVRHKAADASPPKDNREQDASRLIDEGNAEEDAGRLEAAMRCYDEALRLLPTFARGHLNRGNILLRTGDLSGALSAFEAALSSNPDYAPAHFNTGNTLFHLGRTADALSAYENALRLQPEFVDAEVAKGRMLEELGKPEAAAASYRRALALRPDYAEVYSNLGSVLQYLGRFDEAIASLHRSIELNPNYAEAHCNLGNALIDQGRLDVAMASYRHALEIDPDYTEPLSNLLFVHNYRADRAASELLMEARSYGERVARRARRSTNWSNDKNPDRRLRIGLVSGDFRMHPVGYFLENVMAALASKASCPVSLVAYSNNNHVDTLTLRLKACCAGWVSIAGLSDEAAAQRIKDDKIDILVDLSGHTAHTRLSVFAWKPAPVQISWLGYFATTGVAEMDYFLADPWTLPPSEEIHFTEKIWRLPQTRLCFTPPADDVAVGPLPAFSNGYVTFGCFNHLTKMNDDVVKIWARILAAVPGSRLMLRAQQIKDGAVRQSIVERFGACGVAAEQLILEGPVPRAAYLASYQRIDIALDPFPYPGGTTTVEALWMGIPVLTLAGNTFLSRQGVGILMNAGLAEWVAADADDYVRRAASHAADIRSLSALREGLRQQVLASPVFDAARFADHFETALRGMWKKWCAQH